MELMGTQTMNYEPAYDHHEDDQFNDEMYEHHGHLDDDQNHHDHHIVYNDHHVEVTVTDRSGTNGYTNFEL